MAIGIAGEYDSVAWAAISLVINSVLTGSVVIKLVFVLRAGVLAVIFDLQRM
jgi:hypothetical protein